MLNKSIDFTAFEFPMRTDYFEKGAYFLQFRI